MENFPGPFRSPWMFKYLKKRILFHNIQSVVHYRKFRWWENSSAFHNVFNWATVDTNWVLCYCIAACVPFEPLGKWCMHNFQGYFSRTFQDQSDFPWLFRSWNFQENKSRTFREVWKPCYVFYQSWAQSGGKRWWWPWSDTVQRFIGYNLK